MRTPEQIKQDNLAKTSILLRELQDAAEEWNPSLTPSTRTSRKKESI